MTQVEKYNQHIDEHRSNIQKIYKHLLSKKILEKYLCPEDQYDLNYNIDKHDASKYFGDEFWGYQQYFYPNENETPNRNKFLVAWNHHQKNNPHHWEYWALLDSDSSKFLTLEIPIIYVFEMLCDWAAMSLNFNDSPLQFYSIHKYKILLHPETEKLVVKLLSLFDEIVLEIRNNKE